MTSGTCLANQTWTQYDSYHMPQSGLVPNPARLPLPASPVHQMISPCDVLCSRLYFWNFAIMINYKNNSHDLETGFMGKCLEHNW